MLVLNPSLRLLMSRAFVHSEMSKASRSFKGGNLPQQFDEVTGKVAVPSALQNVARVFITLQQARHDADYNLAKSFTRGEAKTLVDQASQAFQDWQTIR